MDRVGEGAPSAGAWTRRDEIRFDEYTLTLGEMPFEELLKFGVAQRVPERYNEKGNHPSDKHGDNLVDTCVATGGVELATKFLVEVCGRSTKGHFSFAKTPFHGDDRAGTSRWRLPSSAQRLSKSRPPRVCSRMNARPSHSRSRDSGMGARGSARVLRMAVVLALLASLQTTQQAREALSKLLASETPRYQIIEEGVWFMPD